MKNVMEVEPKGQVALSREEMQEIAGGSLVETVVKIAWSISEYFFYMGIAEGKRMKALL